MANSIQIQLICVLCGSVVHIFLRPRRARPRAWNALWCKSSDSPILPCNLSLRFPMPISHDTIKTVTAQLYDRSLRGIPNDTKDALRRADDVESNETARHTLRIMLQSAEAAERSQT